MSLDEQYAELFFDSLIWPISLTNDGKFVDDDD